MKRDFIKIIALLLLSIISLTTTLSLVSVYENVGGNAEIIAEENDDPLPQEQILENEEQQIIEEPIAELIESEPKQEQEIYVKEEFYTKTRVNLRKEPNTDCEVIKVLNVNTKVIRGKEENGWSFILEDDVVVGYIKTTLLSIEKVKVETSSRNSTTVSNKKVTKTTSSSVGANANKICLGEYVVTAYCGCRSCSEGYGNNTASGAKCVQGVTIAADPSIPFGTKIEIEGHVYTVQDRGGAIKGNKIDVYFNSHSECLAFGKKKIKVYKIET